MASKQKPASPAFPCATVPDGSEARLLGLYPQRQKGLLMQRLKITGGRLTREQWKKVARLALRYAPGVPLHLTTRQDIEFHGLQPDDVPALQRELDRAGLTTVGACGDTIRAVTVDPESGLTPGTCDLLPWASAIHAHLQAMPGSFALPRKFKVSLSSGPTAFGAKPFINDVAFVALPDRSFQAIVAGSLGARPNPGIVAYEKIPPNQVLPFVTAALRLFAAEGDREKRRQARLRHVRERFGDAAFLERLAMLFAEEMKKDYPPPPPLKIRKKTHAPWIRLSIPNGELDPGILLELLESGSKPRKAPRIGLEQDLYVIGQQPDTLPASLQPLSKASPVIACPGNHYCALGIAPTWPPAEQLRQAMAATHPNLLLAISGCPNGCSHPAIADLGFIGRMKTTDGNKEPHYRLLAGGGRGKTPDLAIELHPAIPIEKVGGAVDWIIRQWQAGRLSNAETLRAFVLRRREELVAGLQNLVVPRV